MKYILFLLLIAPFLSPAQEWELKKNSENIKVYMREVKDTPYKEVMVRMKCRGTLAGFKDIIMDVDNHTRWVYNNEKSRLVKRISENELIYYSEFYLPWPASNRDLTAHVVVITDSVSNTYFVRTQAVNGYIPERSGIVRLTHSQSRWKVVQTGYNKLELEYVITLNPEGNIPSWVVNMTAATGPYHSFEDLKILLEQ